MGALADFNELPPKEAEARLFECCGSRKWASKMAGARPFKDLPALFQRADEIWQSLSREDWLEAFSHHPRIGEKKNLKTQEATEQKGTQGASGETLEKLLQGNRDYEARFGHVFLVCATGKSAQEMLRILQERIHNSPEEELRIAAREQSKITQIRLEKLFQS